MTSNITLELWKAGSDVGMGVCLQNSLGALVNVWLKGWTWKGTNPSAWLHIIQNDWRGGVFKWDLDQRLASSPNHLSLARHSCHERGVALRSKVMGMRSGLDPFARRPLITHAWAFDLWLKEQTISHPVKLHQCLWILDRKHLNICSLY